MKRTRLLVLAAAQRVWWGVGPGDLLEAAAVAWAARTACSQGDPPRSAPARSPGGLARPRGAPLGAGAATGLRTRAAESGSGITTRCSSTWHSSSLQTGGNGGAAGGRAAMAESAARESAAGHPPQHCMPCRPTAAQLTPPPQSQSGGSTWAGPERVADGSSGGQAPGTRGSACCSHATSLLHQAAPLLQPRRPQSLTCFMAGTTIHCTPTLCSMPSRVCG